MAGGSEDGSEGRKDFSANLSISGADGQREGPWAEVHQKAQQRVRPREYSSETGPRPRTHVRGRTCSWEGSAKRRSQTKPKAEPLSTRTLAKTGMELGKTLGLPHWKVGFQDSRTRARQTQ